MNAACRDVYEPIHPLFERHVRPALVRLADVNKVGSWQPRLPRPLSSARTRTCACTTCSACTLIVLNSPTRPASPASPTRPAHWDFGITVCGASSQDEGAGQKEHEAAKERARRFVLDCWQNAMSGCVREHARRRLLASHWLDDLADATEVLI